MYKYNNSFIYVLVVTLVLVGCGSAVSTSSSTTSTDDQASSTSIASLISGGITVDIENTLQGTTWTIKSYDLGESASTISTSSDDTSSIIFTASSTSINTLMYSQITLTDYSASPLYNYEENTTGIQSTYASDDTPTYIACNAGNALCSCASTDHFCAVSEISSKICDSDEDEGADTNGIVSSEGTCYSVSYMQTSDENIADDYYTVNELHEAVLTYEIITTEVDSILRFTLTGIDYAVCGGTAPGNCANSGGDYSGTETTYTTSYLIKGARSDIMAIQTDAEYIILVKN